VRLSVVVVTALCALEALASEPLPQVAPFPLEVKRAPSNVAKKDKEELVKLFPMLVRGADAAVPEGAKLSGALAELKRQDCEREDECLTQLAKLSGALYGLYANVDYNTDKRVVAVGRVVRDDGVVMGPAQTVELPKSTKPFKELARDALTQLLTKLAVGKLSPFRPVAPEPVPVPVPVPDKPVVTKDPALMPPPLPPLQVEQRPSMARTVGWVGLGVGAAVAVAGGLVFATAPAIRKDANGNIFAADKQNFPIAQGQQGAGVGLMIAGVGGGSRRWVGGCAGN
jgi:hypothetical protein